jgi:hypothetical protein
MSLSSFAAHTRALASIRNEAARPLLLALCLPTMRKLLDKSDETRRGGKKTPTRGARGENQLTLMM